MKASDILNEIAYPLTHAAVLMTMALLYVLLSLAFYGGVLGLFLMFLVLPAVFRYLMVLLQWRARGLEAPTLDVDHLNFLGNAWSIFPAFLIAAIGYGMYAISTSFGPTAAYVVCVVVTAVLPASLGVLAISQSPLESMNPVSIGAVIQRCGGSYWIAPTFAIVVSVAVVWLHRVIPYPLVRGFITFYLLFAQFALIGAIMRSGDLMKEADIPDAVEPDAKDVENALIKERTSVLNHAYGFITRDNRAGGFKHIENWLQRDPDPESAWSWFFDQMMRWEIKHPALLFGQSYLSQLLKNGEQLAAVKVMMRCRHENADFAPLADDLGMAIKAAEQCQSQELATFLRSRV
ncbi:MAG: hypothetical protein OES79_16400 [Planctomycetota bacterium]|nr:hypothetical protein [Planctomycetota bacterium]